MILVLIFNNKYWKIQNEFVCPNQFVIKEIPERPLSTEMYDLPTENEVEEAIKELQCGKAAGPDGILPEVFKLAANCW